MPGPGSTIKAVQPVQVVVPPAPPKIDPPKTPRTPDSKFTTSKSPTLPQPQPVLPKGKAALLQPFFSLDSNSKTLIINNFVNLLLNGGQTIPSTTLVVETQTASPKEHEKDVDSKRKVSSETDRPSEKGNDRPVRNSEETARTNSDSTLRNEIHRHFEIIPLPLREKMVPLLNLCSTVEELKTANDFLKLYFNLPEHGQRQVIHELVRQFVSKGREVPAKLIEDLFSSSNRKEKSNSAEKGLETAADSFTAQLNSPESKLSPETKAAVPAAPVMQKQSVNHPEKSFKPFLGSHPLQEMVSALPPKVSTEIKNLLIQIVSAPANPRQMEAFAKKILSLKDFSASVEKIVKAWNHPEPKVRLAVLTVLKHLARTQSAKEFNQVYLPTLKAMARNRQSVLVQAEAIKVLIDLGHRQKKSREEMEALLKELDLIPRIADLLRRDPAKGLALLLSIFDWLHPSFQKTFALKALEIAMKRPARRVMEKALRVIWKGERDFSPEEKKRLIKKGFDVLFRSMNEDMYSKGHDKYAGRQGN